MKRKITREIFVVVETIRVTKKRAVRKKSPERTKTENSNVGNSLVKSDPRSERLGEKYF